VGPERLRRIDSPAVLRRVRSLDGVTIACQTSGRGPPLVLVHGAGSARWGFDLVRPLLEPDFTVIALDRRGRGDSGDAESYRIEREFEDVAAVVSEAGAGHDGPVFLLGHSYGGLVAAGAAPLVGRLTRLILYEPAMGGVLAPPEVTDRWQRLSDDGRREQMVDEFLREVGGYSEAEVAEMRRTPVWDARLTIAHTVPRELRAENAFRIDNRALGRLALPVLMLVGTRSPAWARRSTDAYAAAFPDVRVDELEGHGHGAATSGPDLLAAEIRGFLTGAPA
jgi:pimeloyl-ACP methyl ester carboxylesterase